MRTLNLKKSGLNIGIALLTVYSILHFINGVFGYKGYGDFFLTLDWARTWFKTGEPFHEFGAYPPLYTLTLYPFIKMDNAIIPYVMHTFNLLCLAFVIWIAYRHFAQPLSKEQRKIWLISTLILLLNYRPLLLGLSMIKVEFLQLALIALAFHSFRKGNDFVTGASLALGAFIKFIPGIFLLYFLIKRQWKVVFYAALVGIVLTSITIAFFGLAYHVEYITTLKSGFLPWVDNQSFEAALLRLFVPYPPTSTSPSVQVAPLVTSFISLTKLFILLELLWISRKPITDRKSLQLDWETGVWIVAVPFLLRFFRDYYSIYFIPILFLVVREALVLKKGKKLFMLPFLTAYLLMGQFFPIGIFTRLPQFIPAFGNYDLFLFFSIPFYGFLVLFICCFFKTRQETV